MSPPFWEVAAPSEIFFVGVRWVNGKGTEGETKFWLSQYMCIFSLPILGQQLGEEGGKED